MWFVVFAIVNIIVVALAPLFYKFVSSRPMPFRDTVPVALLGIGLIGFFLFAGV